MSRISMAPWQIDSIYSPYVHTALLGGVATGKTFTGAQYAINRVKNNPHQTGFIGANTYDQMNQASLRELFYWLNEFNIPFVSDQKPPLSWGVNKKIFKDYHNIISIKIYDVITHIFTRVLAAGNPIRGIEFSWYWIDETRDTPKNTHDIILSRMRESADISGLVTSTTNAEDWVYDRFVKGADGVTYGFLKVKTEEAVRKGIITQQYYDSLRKSYSPLLAAQELDAEHVNVLGGRAYYAAGDYNRMSRAPWGWTEPNPDYPLIVGCDFNFSPAPCIWTVGQMDPDEERIHWFGEVFESHEPNTRLLTKRLMGQYPGFFYRVYGDASGNRGTTSNAGETDYNQMAEEFADAGCPFTIDTDQQNPLVKDRVENMNAMLHNALGEVRQTYDPGQCPNLDADLRLVGWKYRPNTGSGKLDDVGDHNRTHASDGAGYAVIKLFPPGKRASIIQTVPNEALMKLKEHI